MALAATARAPVPPTPLSGTLPLGLPALLYGVRLWVAVCLALYIAFQLELPDPSWAGTTAALSCQPAVGASLRKGWFRIVGTVTGALFIVLLTGLFPQSRVGFMAGLALWGGLAAAAATVLRNFAGYAAALSGYTAAIIAGAALGATGGPGDAVFLLAVNRATEILLGIACSSAVLALSDFGGARRRLGALIAAFAAEAADGLAGAVQGRVTDAARRERRDLLLRVAGLSVAMDQAQGEISTLPFNPRALRRAVEGLYEAISAWRVVATHLERRPELLQDAGTAAILQDVAGLTAGARAWGADPLRWRQACRSAVRRLVALETRLASARLVADGLAAGLLGLARALDGVALLATPFRVRLAGKAARPRLADPLPALVNGMRGFLAIGAAELIWVETAWPSGGTFLVFTAVAVTLFVPVDISGFPAARNFMIGTAGAAVVAAVLAFGVLPRETTFLDFCGVLGLALVPAGALSAQAWQQSAFFAFAANILPLLGPTNPESYDPGAFYNNAMAIVLGIALALLAMLLLPPLPPGLRARRLLSLSLRDLRHLAVTRHPMAERDWEALLYARLAAMPDAIELLQPARLAAALFVGSQMLRLRRLAEPLGIGGALGPALRALHAGDSAAAIAGFAALDSALDAMPDREAGRRPRLRARGISMAIAEALAVHADYFGAGGHA